MEYLVNSAQAKAIDTFTIQRTGVPSLVLMERASLAVAEHVRGMADQISGKVVYRVFPFKNIGKIQPALVR